MITYSSEGVADWGSVDVTREGDAVTGSGRPLVSLRVYDTREGLDGPATVMLAVRLDREQLIALAVECVRAAGRME